MAQNPQQENAIETPGIYIAPGTGFHVVSAIGVVNMDMIIDEATITGPGKIIVTGTKQQLIQSNHSVINNLVINNPENIIITGQLSIVHSLTTVKGELLQSEISDDGNTFTVSIPAFNTKTTIAILLPVKKITIPQKQQPATAQLQPAKKTTAPLLPASPFPHGGRENNSTALLAIGISTGAAGSGSKNQKILPTQKITIAGITDYLALVHPCKNNPASYTGMAHDFLLINNIIIDASQIALPPPASC